MSKTRLTKQLRADILDAIMRNTDYEKERQALKAVLAEEALEHLQTSVRAEHPDFYPMLEKLTPTEQAFLPRTGRVYTNPDCDAGYACIEVLEGRASSNASLPRSTPVPYGFDAPRFKLPKTLTQFIAFRRKYDDVKQSTAALLQSVSTVERLAELMPEIAHLLPASETFYAPAIISSDVVAKLMQAGLKVNKAEEPTHA